MSKICLVCTHPNLLAADERLRTGSTHLSVAKMLKVDRQVVGRHVRNGHVSKGNTVAGSGWSSVETVGEIVELPEAVTLAIEDFAFTLHQVDAETVAEHRQHLAAWQKAQDWTKAINDDCPAAVVLGLKGIDELGTAVERFVVETDAPIGIG
jgi:hypothetical protein